MKTHLLVIIALLIASEAHAQLRSLVESITLYTFDSIPTEYRDGGLRFYDNIRKYGPFISVSGKLYNLSDRDSVLEVHIRADEMEIGRWSRVLNYYTVFSYENNRYRSEYYYDDINTTPKVALSKYSKYDNMELYMLCGKRKTDYWFGSHFLYNTPLFPSKKNEWDFLTVEQSEYLDKIAKEVVNDKCIVVDVEVCDKRE